MAGRKYSPGNKIKTTTNVLRNLGDVMGTTVSSGFSVLPDTYNKGFGVAARNFNTKFKKLNKRMDKREKD
jgi:hypothetical protein